MRVFDDSEIQKKITHLGLTARYEKACKYIETGRGSSVDLKLRRPTHHGIWQFRITKKYRAFAFKDRDNLIVYKISDHQ